MEQTLRRVVVTGLGAITPVGNTVEEMWANLKAGDLGRGPGRRVRHRPHHPL